MRLVRSRNIGFAPFGGGKAAPHSLTCANRNAELTLRDSVYVWCVQVVVPYEARLLCCPAMYFMQKNVECML